MAENFPNLGEGSGHSKVEEKVIVKDTVLNTYKFKKLGVLLSYALSFFFTAMKQNPCILYSILLRSRNVVF